MHITIGGIPELADTPDTYLGTLEVLSCKCPSDPNTWPTFPDFSDGELIGMMGSLRTDFGMMGSRRTDFVILKWLLHARNNRGTFEITFCVPFLASDETPLSLKLIKPLPRSMALHLMDAVPHSLCRAPIAERPAQWHVEAVFFADCPDQACLCFTTLDYEDIPGLGLYWRESIAGSSVNARLTLSEDATPARAPAVPTAEREKDYLRALAARTLRDALDAVVAHFPDLTTPQLHAGMMHARGLPWSKIIEQCGARSTVAKYIRRFYEVTGWPRPDRRKGMGKKLHLDESRDGDDPREDVFAEHSEHPRTSAPAKAERARPTR